jgi:Holliday junction resolvase-like predicted endonuclease
VIRSNDHRRNLLDAIRSGRKTICPVEVAVRDQTVVQQEHIALTLGRKLRWDPTAEHFVDDAEANRLMSRPMRSPWHL